LILFILYLIYVVFMKYNMIVREKIFGRRRGMLYKAKKTEPTAFEVGLLGLLIRRHGNIEREVMKRAVVQISGDVKDTFKEFD